MVELINSLRTNSSPGEDGVHNRFLKNLSSKGLDLLLKMINLSLAVGLPVLEKRGGDNDPKKRCNFEKNI